jgi:predicted phosphodiesterase
LRIDNITIWNKFKLLYDNVKRGLKREDLTLAFLIDYLQVNKSIAEKFMFILENFQFIENSVINVVDVNDLNSKVLLVFADLHIPFENKNNLEIMFNYVKSEVKKVDIIVILGDLLDCYKLSKYLNKPIFNFNDELQAGYNFLCKLRNMFEDAEIIYKSGNHEDRFDNYILTYAKEIYYLVDNLLSDKLKLSDLKVKYIKDYFSIGKLYFLHGHEFYKSKNFGVNFVDSYFKLILDNFVVGHYHKTKEVLFKKAINNDVYIGVGLGAMAGKLDYAIINNFDCSFGIVRFDEKGNFIFDLKKIVNNNIY